eukprot:1147981-Pelagomonas_calceolata.AAC.1
MLQRIDHQVVHPSVVYVLLPWREVQELNKREKSLGSPGYAYATEAKDLQSKEKKGKERRPPVRTAANLFVKQEKAVVV